MSNREAAAEALIPAVSDPEAPVRRAAVEALGKVGGAAVEDILISAGTDVDAGVRGETALALFRRRFLKRVPEYSTASLNKLLILAADPDPEVRWRAVYAFTRFPDARAEKILAAATRDPDRVTRLFAVRSLSRLGRAADMTLFSDPDVYVRAEVVASFGAAKAGADLPATVFADPSAHVRAAAADALAATERADLAGLLEKMADADSPMPRGRALIALAKLRGVAEAARLLRARENPPLRLWRVWPPRLRLPPWRRSRRSCVTPGHRLRFLARPSMPSTNGSPRRSASRCGRRGGERISPPKSAARCAARSRRLASKRRAALFLLRRGGFHRPAE
jgi:hypothetical protein